MPQDYNDTLNLPKTDFPMRAGLPQQEPKLLEDWEKNELYLKMVDMNVGKTPFILHDGPPYANAAIHLGTALNKVLKDIIVRSKNMMGYYTPYIPGWDTHGLPIELKAIKEYGVDITKDPVVLRKHCHDFALTHIETQKEQFKRLGSLADYDHPYLTLNPEYEAKQIEIFGSMAEKGYIYRDLKSVYWCPKCVTALAEAEIEYAEDEVDSIYVKFNVVQDPNNVLKQMGANHLSNTYLLIWTTTTWTLPANQAICVGPDFDYVLVQTNNENLIIAQELVEAVMQTANIADYKILGSVKGRELEYILYKHPFLERISPIILGEHVTLESGTGEVHTAPGHGVEDFDVIANFYADYFKEEGVIVPVDEHGKMTAEAGEWLNGLDLKDANKRILENLKETNHLFSIKHLVHQYPHCWRCSSPIIFRATEQWFCSVEDFKPQTLKSIQEVSFIPEWGKARMSNMVSDRKAWTLSRQRAWGVPIPILYCDDCHQPVINQETITYISALFAKEGSDSWYIRPANELLPSGFVCPHCNTGTTFTKETDTMDVWFDSGCSHASVLAQPGQTWPADLYLEGGDQYRGWFQSSLLTAVAWRGEAPYKAICTHGMVVDELGRKQSKSLGNGIAPEEVVNKYGADILRLWVASSDYQTDIHISDNIIKQLSESYRKIRNTARYILGNLFDFNPNTDSIVFNNMESLDQWALTKIHDLVEICQNAYNTLDFHVIYHQILNFCTVDISNFYLDIIKDRLYVEQPDGIKRRSAQTAIYQILHHLTLLIAPVLPFTTEEIWKYMPHHAGVESSYALLNKLELPKEVKDNSFMKSWEELIILRDAVNKALEEARNKKTIGKSLEACVILTVTKALHEQLLPNIALLKTIFIVSAVELQLGSQEQDYVIEVVPAFGKKCERCWVIDTTVGKDIKHPTLCSRCAGIIG